jgi:hypothetical protein
MKCDCGLECGVLYVKRFGSKNSLSPSEGGSRGGSRKRKQVVEAIASFRGAQAIFRAKPFHVQYPTFSTAVTLHTYSPMKMEQTVFRNVGI